MSLPLLKRAIFYLLPTGKLDKFCLIPRQGVNPDEEAREKTGQAEAHAEDVEPNNVQIVLLKAEEPEKSCEPADKESHRSPDNQTQSHPDLLDHIDAKDVPRCPERPPEHCKRVEFRGSLDEIDHEANSPDTHAHK
eukprot:CAMPEP_0114503390 /NCGR_PEP_ID=MMETSP0109-20121206/9621_1 /TAXON_ID=29199 /ORGANISM="Chlorarachnion reptans, Strain CCCM449" /LENGTH=135 /DNA_ID=CAMNT_0001681413 /DNA_START=691 /DNA_END=1098 /DNA_ORIENTATION=-